MTDDLPELRVARCPSCNAEIDELAVLCISCGYHLRKGTHLSTTKVDDEAGEIRKHSRSTSVIHSGNVIVLCSGSGLMLGILSALVLGVLDGSGVMSFEMGIYVFVGIVLGTVIGGGIGFALSPFLPNASAETSSEQLVGGLFRVIGGFMVTGVGLVSFGVFSDMDAGKGGPERMPKVAIALYELLGKWGVLVIMGGAGLTLIVLGVKAMLPSKDR